MVSNASGGAADNIAATNFNLDDAVKDVVLELGGLIGAGTTKAVFLSTAISGTSFYLEVAGSLYVIPGAAVTFISFYG